VDRSDQTHVGVRPEDQTAALLHQISSGHTAPAIGMRLGLNPKAAKNAIQTYFRVMQQHGFEQESNRSGRVQFSCTTDKPQTQAGWRSRKSGDARSCGAFLVLSKDSCGWHITQIELEHKNLCCSKPRITALQATSAVASALADSNPKAKAVQRAVQSATGVLISSRQSARVAESLGLSTEAAWAQDLSTIVAVLEKIAEQNPGCSAGYVHCIHSLSRHKCAADHHCATTAAAAGSISS